MFMREFCLLWREYLSGCMKVFGNCSQHIRMLFVENFFCPMNWLEVFRRKLSQFEKCSKYSKDYYLKFWTREVFTLLHKYKKHEICIFFSRKNM